MIKGMLERIKPPGVKRDSDFAREVLCISDKAWTETENYMLNVLHKHVCI